MREARAGPHDVAYPGLGLGLRKYSGGAARALSPRAPSERGLEESRIGKLRGNSPDPGTRGGEPTFTQLLKINGNVRLKTIRRPCTLFRTVGLFAFINARKAAIPNRRQLFCAAFPTFVIAGFIALS